MLKLFFYIKQSKTLYGTDFRVKNLFKEGNSADLNSLVADAQLEKPEKVMVAEA
jgi:hypothetical protein